MNIPIELLEAIRDELNKSNDSNNDPNTRWHETLGLCTIIWRVKSKYLRGCAEIWSYEDFEELREAIGKHASHQRLFWNHNGEITKDDDQFVWPPYAYEPRLEFMDNLIKLAK